MARKDVLKHSRVRLVLDLRPVQAVELEISLSDPAIRNRGPEIRHRPLAPAPSAGRRSWAGSARINLLWGWLHRYLLLERDPGPARCLAARDPNDDCREGGRD